MRLKQIDEFYAEVSLLRSQLNATLAISALPDEVLAEILLQCVQKARDVYTAGASGDNERGPYSWIGITHVCRRWRQVALDYPSLWNWIVPINPVSTNIFIQRSAQLPLVVPERRISVVRYSPPRPTLFNPFPMGRHPSQHSSYLHENAELSLQILYRQFHRIASITLAINDMTPQSPVAAAPMLHSLTIGGPKPHSGGPTESMLNFLKGLDMPVLTAFHSAGHIATLQPCLRPSLQNLTIGCNPLVGESKTQLLEALRELPSLRHLRIDGTSSTVADVYSGFQQPLTSFAKVSLPLLHSLCLQSVYANTVRFLDYLEITSSVSITVIECASSPELEMMDRLLQQLDSLGGPNAPLAMAIHIQRPGDYNKQQVMQGISLWCSGSNDTTYRPFAEWGAPRISYFVRESHQLNSRQFSTHLFGDRISTLFIGIKAKPQLWFDSFAEFRQLQQLHVHGEAVYALPEALSPEEPHPSRGETGLFPALCTLVLDSIIWNANNTPVPDILVATLADIDPHGPSRKAPLAALVRALGRRGGIQQVVVRRGRLVTKGDIEALALNGHVATMDWDEVSLP